MRSRVILNPTVRSRVTLNLKVKSRVILNLKVRPRVILNLKWDHVLLEFKREITCYFVQFKSDTPRRYGYKREKVITIKVIKVKNEPDRGWRGQCCGSGMFITDPDIYPSRIPDLGSRIQQQQQKSREQNVLLSYLFLAQISQNFNLFYFLTGKEKNLSQFTKNYGTSDPKNSH